MFKKVTLLIFGVGVALAAGAQNLDRISLSSGGASTNEVHYVLGETFNFTMAQGGTVTIESGTLGSTENSGGLQNTVSVRRVTELKPIACYPNPATDAVYFTLNNRSHNMLSVNVFDSSGKLLVSEKLANADILKLNVQTLAQGTYFTTVSDAHGAVLGSFQFIKK